MARMLNAARKVRRMGVLSCVESPNRHLSGGCQAPCLPAHEIDQDSVGRSDMGWRVFSDCVGFIGGGANALDLADPGPIGEGTMTIDDFEPRRRDDSYDRYWRAKAPLVTPSGEFRPEFV